MRPRSRRSGSRRATPTVAEPPRTPFIHVAQCRRGTSPRRRVPLLSEHLDLPYLLPGASFGESSYKTSSFFFVAQLVLCFFSPPQPSGIMGTCYALVPKPAHDQAFTIARENITELTLLQDLLCFETMPDEPFIRPSTEPVELLSSLQFHASRSMKQSQDGFAMWPVDKGHVERAEEYARDLVHVLRIDPSAPRNCFAAAERQLGNVVTLSKRQNICKSAAVCSSLSCANPALLTCPCFLSP